MENNLTIITLDSPNLTDFASARNAELNNVTTEWVLFIDKDEKVSAELEEEINRVIQDGNRVAYSIRRIDTFLGRELQFGETGRGRFVRLARKDAGVWQRPVHEVWQVTGEVGELQNPLTHNPHASIAEFLKKIDRYSTLDADYRHRVSRRSSLTHIVCYPIGKFLYNYIWLQGFRDGIPGLIMALMMSFHSFLTWTKLYLHSKKMQ